MPDIHFRLHKNILWLILDRPSLNPLTTEMLDLLTTSIHRAIKSPPSIVVITGMGEQAFCVGVDLPDDTEAQRTELLRAAKDACTALEELRVNNIPTVALVKGHAFGSGCELAVLCDTVIAREDAQFRLPAVNAKVFPCAISLALPAAIGHENTDSLMRSGETLTAKEAMRLGLVHQVLPTRRFLLDTEELLVMLATRT